MKKYLLVLVSLCCVLSAAFAENPDYPELKNLMQILSVMYWIKDERTFALYYSRTERHYDRNCD